MKNLLGAIRWKTRQKYSQIRCNLGRGHYIWKLENGIQFVSRQGDAFSHVLYVCKGHEKVEMSWCRRWIKAGEPGQSIIDCGANIGYFSAVLAQACSLNQILAIEGNKRTAEICKQNFALLGIENATVIEAILSASSFDKYVIPDLPGREPWQQAVKTDASPDVFTTTLDEIVAEYKMNPSLVKIDCEGFEAFILKGANYLLSYLRPALMIECNDKALKSAGSSRDELLELLQSFDYKLFHLASFTSREAFGVEVNNGFSASEFNFSAIPNDKINLKKWYYSVNFN